jgi:hypothetical protein
MRVITIQSDQRIRVSRSGGVNDIRIYNPTPSSRKRVGHIFNYTNQSERPLVVEDLDGGFQVALFFFKSDSDGGLS